MELKLYLRANPLKSLSSINRTFMELKFWRALQINVLRPYQSNLYGIEMCIWPAGSISASVYQSNLYGIEIIFGGLVFYSYLCINRTFMELKLVSPSICQVFFRGYQSNLYGIEILKSRRLRGIVLRINRTFMELKSIRGIPSEGSGRSINRTFMELKCGLQHTEASLTMYQSNLYGIEIKGFFSRSVGIGVSIEPLWNWNWATGV